MMLFSFKNILFLCLVLFTRAPSKAADADAGNERKPYLTCRCKPLTTVVNLTLDAKTAEKIYNKINVFLKPISGFNDIKDCGTCEIYVCNCYAKKKLNFSLCKKTKGNKSKIIVKRSASRVILPQVIDLPTADGNISIMDAKRSSRVFYQVIHTPIAAKRNNSKIIDKQAAHVLPQIIHIPIGGLKKNTRQIRQATACSIPPFMQTAELTCRTVPSSVTCIQRCAFGFTLEGGITQEMHCNFKQNKWIPHRFRECRPFVDCNIHLASRGLLNCTGITLTKEPECKVECLHYEDKDPVPQRTYSCDINGKWNPPLPYCAIGRTGLVLVKAPKKKIHDDLELPSW